MFLARPIASRAGQEQIILIALAVSLMRFTLSSCAIASRVSHQPNDVPSKDQEQSPSHHVAYAMLYGHPDQRQNADQITLMQFSASPTTAKQLQSVYHKSQ